ncbi:hypothetical protein [Halalkalibacter alkalisediminis]|uniref:Endolytic transglycosylase MltG n=1 Tax=Halalkalibacter alkalisediminis TaxID=935616 RepID=A0ABV6NJR5_9BACI|nr:hypothetical protein [Halalkalibacter alkalisediminis]
MTSKTMQSFASGLLVAAGVCAAVYFFGTSDAPTTQAQAQVKEKMTAEEMIASLGADGFVIHTEEQWHEQVAAFQAEVEAAEQPEVVEEAKEEEPEKEQEVKEVIIYRTLLTVSPGMTSIDVGEALVRAEITDSAMTFFKEVEKRGLANSLRPGTFEVDSEMSLDQVISTIFK